MPHLINAIINISILKYNSEEISFSKNYSFYKIVTDSVYMSYSIVLYFIKILSGSAVSILIISSFLFAT